MRRKEEFLSMSLTVLPRRISYVEAKERGENTLDEPHSAS
jgi:hypothetical protein